MGTYVITGSNRGIGLELARQAKEQGHAVIALCRKPSDALSALGVRVLQGVDVTDSASISAAAQELDGVSIDVLILNAGILLRESLDDMDFAQIEEQFSVNALGPLRVTHALMAQLAPSAKVAIITSRMGSIADNTSGSRYGYRMSKAAVNMAGVSLAHDLKPKGVAVALLHPGFVRTEMTGRQGNIDAPEAAQQLHARINALTLQTSGTFWHANGEVLPW